MAYTIWLIGYLFTIGLLYGSEDPKWSKVIGMFLWWPHDLEKGVRKYGKKCVDTKGPGNGSTSEY